MNRIQVAMLKRYATEENVNRIIQLPADIKITLFDIQRRYPKISRIRGGLRRILPHAFYRYKSGMLDHFSEKQRIVWLNRPDENDVEKTVLLFPPHVEMDTGRDLVSHLNPSWIHSVMTGIDHLPPLADTTLVTNSRGVHSFRIAEFVMACIFAYAKNIVQHVNQNRKRVWKAIPSTMVTGSKLGIVGLGSIGAEIAQKAKICGMEVWATKRNADSCDCVDIMLKPNELPILLREVDFIVLAVPLTPETLHLIGKDEFAVMKNTAILINISRGAVVDEDAMYAALKYQNIRGACIDVFIGEKPLPLNSRFYNLPNLLITSFSAFYSVNSTEQVLDVFRKNLERFILEKPLLNQVDRNQLACKYVLP